MIQPRIEILREKKLVGMQATMSWEHYTVAALWRSFMPRLKEISNRLTNDLISMAIYKANHFTNLKATNEFEKWASVEVSSFDNIPSQLESFILEGGLYAVFDYKGLNTDNTLFQYIFENWLPHSDYVLDGRPHFEILGNKYKNNDPESEEEIWIPIKEKL